MRDLEARVEVLSGDKEERVELMTLLIRNLLKENKDLRSMLKSMTAFVGDGKLYTRTRLFHCARADVQASDHASLA